MKYILFIGDGMADQAVASLGGKTPLQAVPLPFIDSLAERGEVVAIKNCPPHLPAGSDTAILSILGYDPSTYYTGRAPLEAAASGILLEDGDVAYRCNLISVEEKPGPLSEKIIHSHCGHSVAGEDALEIINALLSHPDFSQKCTELQLTIHPSPSFRHMTVQKGASLDNIELAPPHDHLGELMADILPKGNQTAAQLLELMELGHEILTSHPLTAQRSAQGKPTVNGIWLWAEGTGVSLPSFEERFGHTGAMISAVPLCHGIARLIGLDVLMVEGATGELDTNYQGKVDAALQALETHDFVAIHVEAPDECTHAGNLEEKLEAISFLESKVMSPLVQQLKNDDFRLIFLSDHRTLISTRGHDHGYVPCLVYQNNRDLKSNSTFDEITALQGRTFENGHETCMPLLFDTPLN
ncbi:MAG: 2,3-bisphosphoglycerate-independent phosphoglycerate mutase [Eubacteriales bacterium]